MKTVAVALLVLLSALVSPAAVDSGSSRDEVIATYGEPKGSTSLGSKEILVYPRGRVWLVNGKVVRSELPLGAGGPAVSPTPAKAAVAPTPKVAPMVPAPESWRTDFVQSKAEAGAKRKLILALFTGSDWCPACQRFEREVAHNVEFLRPTQVSFVLLKLDYPQNSFQPPALRQQNEDLRRHFEIGEYPTLLVMSADGERTVKVDLSRGRPAADTADFFVQAVSEARKKFDDLN